MTEKDLLCEAVILNAVKDLLSANQACASYATRRNKQILCSPPQHAKTARTGDPGYAQDDSFTARITLRLLRFHRGHSNRVAIDGPLDRDILPGKAFDGLFFALQLIDFAFADQDRRRAV